MMLSQTILNSLFKALDVAEELRSAYLRLRGKPEESPPWDTAVSPSVPPAPEDVEEPPLAETVPPRKPRAAKKPSRVKPAKAKPRGGAKKRASPPRATPATWESFLQSVGAGELAPPPADLALDGKTMNTRLLWAIVRAEQALGRGLTAPEVAQVLEAAGLKSAPSNIMRTVRQDGGKLFAKGPRSGNAVTLVLTEKGRGLALSELPAHPG
jgi:hypothetical protein